MPFPKLQKQMTDKERVVLHQFVEVKGYQAYPAQVERDTAKRRKKVSRRWAGKICKEFEKRGILGYDMIRPRRKKNETEHYKLKNDTNAFLEISRMLLLSGDASDRWVFMNYMQDKINPSLVKEVLCLNGVMMQRVVEDEPLDLPIFPDEISRDEQIKKIKQVNYQYADVDRLKFDWLDEHYEFWENEKLILPILALIQISSSAMTEFLFGDWEPDFENTLIDSQGTKMIEHLLFRLMFLAIGDLAIYRNVPESSIVKDAVVRQGNFLKMEEDALLCLRLKDSSSLYYDGGFDTDHMYYDTYEVQTNPENCRIKTWKTTPVNP